MKNYARTLAIVVALGLVGFLATLGLMSVLFATQTDSFAPKNSADAAGWVQAIGSIIAILASYHLGARQAAQSQRQEVERQSKQKAKQESIGTLVQTSSDHALRAIMMLLRGQGNASVIHIIPGAHKVLDETLATLQTVPMAEVEPPGQMQHIAGIISSLTHIKGAMTALQAALKPPRGTKVYDPGALQLEMEHARISFHHGVMYQAVSVYDHLTALGFPSKQANPIFGYDELRTAESARN